MRNDNLQKYIQLRHQLEGERSALQSRLHRLNEALETIEGSPAPLSGGTSSRRGRMSAAARARIAAAQRKRWAASRKTTNNGAAKPVKRKMSAAGRKKIAEAARKRWAAAKAAGKNSL